jgi:hypothetical protein
MSAESAFSEALAALARFYIGESTLEESLHRVSELTAEALDPVDFVGLTMSIEGTRRTAVFTDRLSPEIDQAQYDSGEGPCLEAFETGEVVAVNSMSDTGPYPVFRAAAFLHGINCTLSLPMIVDHGTVGAMNLYSHPHGGRTLRARGGVPDPANRVAAREHQKLREIAVRIVSRAAHPESELQP